MAGEVDGPNSCGQSRLRARRVLDRPARSHHLGRCLTAEARTKSCTARSMAFRKAVWERVGGFPETSFLIDDSGFDLRVRSIYRPTYVADAKALYRPHHTLKSAVGQLTRYGFADGVAGIRRARFFRHLARCVAEVAALALLPKTTIPLICVLLLELYFALRLDWQNLLQAKSLRAVAARLLFSLIVPWVVSWTYITGAIVKSNKPNAQNASLRDLRPEQ